MTCLPAYMYRQISKCTDKTTKKHYGGGGTIIPPPPPPAMLVWFTALKLSSSASIYLSINDQICQLITASFYYCRLAAEPLHDVSSSRIPNPVRMYRLLRRSCVQNLPSPRNNRQFTSLLYKVAERMGCLPVSVRHEND